MKPLSACIAGVVLAVLGLQAAPAGEPPRARGDAERGGQRVFFFQGTPREIGRRHGAIFKEELRFLLDNYLGPFLGTGGRRILARAVMLTAASRMSVPDAIREEMQGIAEGAGMEYADVLLANTVFDSKKAIMCTTFAAKGPEVFFARNLDFLNLGVLHRHTAVFVMPADDGGRLAIVSFPGLVGALTGINSRGLACGVMECGGKGHNPDGEPYAMTFRRVLESCATVKEAAALIEKAKATTANNLMIADAGGDAAVMEIQPSGARLRRTLGRYVYATNHFLEENPGERRLRIIESCIAGGPEPSMALAAEVLLKTAPADANIQAMVFFPARRTVFLSAGKLPAAAGPYVPLGAQLLGLGGAGKRRMHAGGFPHQCAEALGRALGAEAPRQHPNADAEFFAALGAAAEALAPEDLLFSAARLASENPAELAGALAGARGLRVLIAETPGPPGRGWAQAADVVYVAAAPASGAGLAAALAGIIAGTILGYIFEYAQRFSQETPLIWAFDIRTAGLICLMVTLSAIFSAALATQPVIRQKAITILRDR